ncbi:hypothetical protein ABB37_00367 [Leptomonas pyrrhocoris]|uniref:Uncharacterized protein n=1 Tax=Leptomonas pyrrhocoris TaxID=157538 RepID=A0A0N0E071_LEPPY|nr:hypothetical protein ABB37_00367 [Leptomonas pyrrhocoris]KPA86105.1 hypothetical protein ABB37_00367 [Leptomonas pyrrhocoris]|eukprot:XP_015664544.1 hypothetical protein ABB37_00367 [Leptomonas pyrrhocoris]
MQSSVAPGLHFRGWILMSFISVVLLIIVGVPAAYIPTTRNRTIYVAVVTPVVWFVYNLIAYFILYRPMVHCTSVFRTGACCSTKYTDGDKDAQLLTKEMYQLNNGLHALKCETGEMKSATVFIHQQLDSQRNEDDIAQDVSPFTRVSPMV